jgi:2-keto-4-pentenoate hydratase/2-oxohepta-3-ene-1,7-dioic acid hydratase in catechol pathway
VRHEQAVGGAQQRGRVVDHGGRRLAGNGGCLAELWGLRGDSAPAPLKPGDTVTLTVEGIGSVSDTVVPGADPVPLPAGRRRYRERP